MSAEKQKTTVLSASELMSILIASAKQLPMAVEKGSISKCPICKTMVHRDAKYCSECGQKIFFEEKPC